MNKLISLIVAAMFTAVSGSALAAAHAGAQDKKMEKSEKAKTTDTKKKTEKTPKKTQKKGEDKKK